MSCDCQLERTIDWEKGVRGYLGFQDAMNDHVLDAFSPIFEERAADFKLAFRSLLEASKFIVASELKVREHERESILSGRTRETEYFGTAVDFNSQAIRSLDRARKLIRDIPESLLEELKQPDISAIDDGRAALFQGLSKFNVMPVEFKEVLQIWDEVVSVGVSEGGQGLVRQIDANIDTLIRLRAQPDRGNAPHSPLPWWKYVVIAVVIGAGVFGIAACFIWSACTWVWPAISAVAPWVFGMIDRGC